MKYSPADKWFSIFIRLRDSDENGIVRCVTCGNPMFWKNAECGHFIKRQFNSVRFSEINCNVQCTQCNWSLQGNDVKYRAYLVNKYGEEKIVKLELSRHNYFKLGKFEEKVIAEEYKKKSIELAKSKKLKI